MNEWASGFAGAFVSLDADLEGEFGDRLRESTNLAFRVAYGVLRHRQDAEDVAQEAFAKAYRRFRQLRDRDRFRARLVRMTWRTAIDRWRSDRQRTTREQAGNKSRCRPRKRLRCRANDPRDCGAPSMRCRTSFAW